MKWNDAQRNASNHIWNSTCSGKYNAILQFVIGIIMIINTIIMNEMNNFKLQRLILTKN